MDSERRDKILRDQAERKRVQQERQELVNLIGYKIKTGSPTFHLEKNIQPYAFELLHVVERIILNAQHGRSSRHQFADGHNTLAGVDMNLDDIDSAIDVLRKILKI